MKKRFQKITSVVCAIAVTANSVLMSGCSRSTDAAPVPSPSVSERHTDVTPKPDSDDSFEGLLRTLDELAKQTEKPADKKRLRKGGGEPLPKTSEQTETPPEPLLVESWPFWKQYFHELMQITWDDFVALAKKAQAPIDPDVKNAARPPKPDSCREIFNDLSEIQKEHEKLQHLNPAQLKLLTDALAKAKALTTELEAAPKKIDGHFNELESLKAKLTRVVMPAIESVDALKTRRVPREELTETCSRLLAPEGSVGAAVNEVVANRGAIGSTISKVKSLCSDLEARAKALEKTLAELKKVMPDDPRVQRSHSKSKSLRKALRDFAVATGIMVAAFIHPVLGLVLLLAKLIFGGKGKDSGGRNGDKTGDQKGTGATTDQTDSGTDPFKVPDDSTPLQIETADGPHRVQLVKQGYNVKLLVWFNEDPARRVDLGFDFNKYTPEAGFQPLHDALTASKLKIVGVSPMNAEGATNYPVDVEVTPATGESVSFRYASVGADPVLLQPIPQPPAPIEVDKESNPIPFATHDSEGSYHCLLDTVEDTYQLTIWSATNENDYVVLPLGFGQKIDGEAFATAIDDRGLALRSLDIPDDSVELNKQETISLYWELNGDAATYRFEKHEEGWNMLVD